MVLQLTTTKGDTSRSCITRIAAVAKLTVDRASATRPLLFPFPAYRGKFGCGETARIGSSDTTHKLHHRSSLLGIEF